MVDLLSNPNILYLKWLFFSKQPFDNHGNMPAKILFSRSSFIQICYAKILFSHSRLSPQKYYFRVAISLLNQVVKLIKVYLLSVRVS